MKGILKAVWLFCSYLFVPQWGRNKGNTDDTDFTDGIASLEIGQKSERKSFKNEHESHG